MVRGPNSLSLETQIFCPGREGSGAVSVLILDCYWGKEGDVQGKFPQRAPHPEPPARCPQALTFPDQLYDAVFDGVQVTSKTPIRLYGGALLSEYCWGRLWGGDRQPRDPQGPREHGEPSLCRGSPSQNPRFGQQVCLCWVCAAILWQLVDCPQGIGTVLSIIWDKALIECLLCAVHHLGIGVEK